MEEQQVYIGTKGSKTDPWQPVRFKGELLASMVEFNDEQWLWWKERLYRTADGRLVVHQTCEHIRSVPDWAKLYKVVEADLDTGGRFERLGWEAGFGRALTLIDALSDDE